MLRPSGGFGLAAGMLAVLLVACSPLPPTESTSDPAESTSDPAPSAADTTTGPSAPAVADVPGAPGAAAAVQRFVNDLVVGRSMTEPCWSIAPVRVRQMYADRDPIVSALTATAAATVTAVTWSDGDISATVTYPQITAGYACPYVAATDDPDPRYTAADAVYVVQRYLVRLAGRPVNPADTESNHPLICAAGTSPTSVRDNPSPFASVGLVDPTGAATQHSPEGEVRVTIPAEINGLWRDVTALVRPGDDGYCLEELGSSA